MAKSRPDGLLFLCVANSSRSQMAEGLARHLAPAGTPIFSAGSEPAILNPLAVAAMAEIGLDISGHYSKPIAAIDASVVGTVITLCAEEVCPVLPGAPRLLHWPFEDPAAKTGTRKDQLDAFRRVRDQIRERLSSYLQSP